MLSRPFSAAHDGEAAGAPLNAEGCHVLSNSPLLAWFFTLILVLLAGRATARLVLARRSAARYPLSPAQRHRELAHAAMGFGMALLLVPGVPRPPQGVSVGFFAGLAALAVFDWGRRLWDARHGREGVDSCAPTGERTHLLDPHHAIVGVAMIVMLLRPSGTAAGPAAAMPGMAMGGASPNATVLVFLAYVWMAALVLGYGMTRVLAADRPSGALLSSPATVYACELAMTVLTGLMLLS
jgi:hypothetical protein